MEAAEACVLAPLSTDGAISDGLREVAIASLAATKQFTHSVKKGMILMVDQRERQRKKALIIFQIVIYGYLALMFGIQLYMSFARGWWNL